LRERGLRELLVFKAVGEPVGEFQAVVTLASLKELEGLLILNRVNYYFENEDSYFAILDNVLYRVEKRKRKRKNRPASPSRPL